MALSQCLEDSLDWIRSEVRKDSKMTDVYDERQRLALETLVSKGIGSFTDFLNKEGIANFLSDNEIQQIVRCTAVPRCVSLIADDLHLEQLNSLDCSSVTYFPEISDLEPPVLELGWPAFTTGSFRGVTRAVAYFQPSYGGSIYSCKEAARRMIKSAKEVIAIVTDSLTDLDIFRDLQETCTQRCVPVYILLEHTSLPAFLQMCKNINVQLDNLQHMRVRTLTGSTYYMRSGVHITGKVHERFMLIDGNRAATGSYRFNWTDGKINSSNLIELSGQITENFDEEFRILYAQSLPVNAKVAANIHNNGIYEYQLHKQTETNTSTSVVCKQLRLTSTPNQAHIKRFGKERDPESVLEFCPFNLERKIEQDCTPANKTPLNASTLNVSTKSNPAALFCHTYTQTSYINLDDTMQLKVITNTQDSCTLSSSDRNKTDRSSHSSPSTTTTPRGCSHQIEVQNCPNNLYSSVSVGSNVREFVSKLLKERHQHLSIVRSKLDNMMMMLSHGREKLDPAGWHNGVKDGVLDRTWPRSRCLQ